MKEFDPIHEVVMQIRESMETPERDLPAIVIPPFAAAVRFGDFETFYAIRNGQVSLHAAKSKENYIPGQNWFSLSNYLDKLDFLEEKTVLLDPRTGNILNDIGKIDKTVHKWRAGSGAMIPWGGGSSIGRLCTLREKDINRFQNSHYDPIAEECFIKTSKGKEEIIARNERITKIPQVGDVVIALNLAGDNFFDFQLLREDPSAEYHLQGVYQRSSKDGKVKPFVIGTYHLGQDVSPIQVKLKIK